jgi:hypothetical protein
MGDSAQKLNVNASELAPATDNNIYAGQSSDRLIIEPPIQVGAPDSNDANATPASGSARANVLPLI